MSFYADKQTLDDLNIIGKFRNGSVFHLFNEVKTRGGEQLLDTMFRTPLTNEQQINQRSEVFRFFQHADLQLPADAQQINLLREFLDSGTGNSLAYIFTDTLIKRVLSTLMRDERFKKDIQGLHAAISIIKNCKEFMELLPKIPEGFQARVKAIRELLADKRLENLSRVDIFKTIPLQTIISYHHLLKTKLLAEMEDLLLFIYELDVSISVGAVASTQNFVYAEAHPSSHNVFQVENLWHPNLEKAVGNSLQLSQSNNVLFLTGANMAGKSTLMKSVGISIYLAHIGFPIAASSMHFSIREGLYSSINVADNINLGYSHFYAEVMRVKQAAEATSTGKHLLLMFDELFKGTNVKDAYDGTLAVTQAFSEYKNCLFIVSTHIIEVGQALKNRPNIQFCYMPTIMDGSRPRYNYKMQNGITEDRQGMIIIQNEGILELIGD